MKKIISPSIQRTPKIFKRNPELARYMAERTHKIIIDGKAVGTGFLISPTELLTCLHTVTIIQPTQYGTALVEGQQKPIPEVTDPNNPEQKWRFFASLGGGIPCPETVTVKSAQESIAEQIVIQTQRGRFTADMKFIDPLFDMAIYQLAEPSEFYLDLPVRKPEIGEKVFIGGYPLTQSEFTFHKGMISSVSDSGIFTIDGTIVRGNSGSPVIMVSESGTAYLIGFVDAEIVDIDGRYAEAQERLARLTRKHSGLLAYNDHTGHALRSTGILKDIELIYDLIIGNMSTGIGEAVSFAALSDGTADFKFSGLPVKKGEKFFGWMANNRLAQYWYHRHLKPELRLSANEPIDAKTTEEYRGPYEAWLKTKFKKSMRAEESAKKEYLNRYRKDYQRRDRIMEDESLPSGAGMAESEQEEEGGRMPLDEQLADIDRGLCALERNEVFKSAKKCQLIKNLTDKLDALLENASSEKMELINPYKERLEKYNHEE